MISPSTASPIRSDDLLEIIPAVVAYIDAEGFYRRLSREFEQWCGIRREDCLDRHYTEVFPEVYGDEYIRQAAPHLRRALKGEPAQFESCIRSFGGERNVRVSYTPDRDETGAVCGVVVLLTDISDLKRARQQATETEERLRLAAEAVNMGFWDQDLVNDKLIWNAACFRVLGFPESAVPPRMEEFSARIHPDDRAHRAALFAAAQAGRGAYRSEYRILAPDGSWRWIHSRGHFIAGPDGHSVRALGVVFDITEARTAAENAARQTRQIDQILECTTDGVFKLDRNARFTYLNARAKAILSDERDLLGASLWEAFPLAKARKFGLHYERVLCEHTPASFEEYYPEPLNRWFEVHAYPTDDGFVAFFRDVTERRRAEEALRLQEQAIASVPIGITIARRDPANGDPLVFVNPAFEQITGYEKSEVLGRNCEFLHGPETDPAVLASIYEAVGKGQPVKAAVHNYRKSGESFVNEVQISPVRDDRGNITHLVGIQNDVTERIQAAERLTRQAQFDSVTGIPNRYLFRETLKQALRPLHRHKGREIAVVYIDIDNLKQVNDTLGHQGGDRLLKQIGRRIQSAVRQTDVAARIGGDEFAILLTEYKSRASVERLIERILKRISVPARVCGREVVATASAGYAVAPLHSTDPEDLLRKADLAMYSAKRDGRNTWRAYQPSMDCGSRQVLDIAAGLRHALRRDEFILMYQPRMDAASGRIHSLEALIRWQHPERGLIFPGDFIPVAEETGLIVEIGQWVLQEAIRQLAAWRREGYTIVPVSVNVSAAQFRNPAFPDLVSKSLSEGGIEPEMIEIELTESIFMDESVSNDLLTALRNIGVRVAIDDFGTGYSGLGYLGRFSVDILKIDRAFTNAIQHNAASASICRSILHLAQELRLTTVAEGVETAEQASLLRDWGCDQLQGFHFSRAVPAEKIAALLPAAG